MRGNQPTQQSDQSSGIFDRFRRNPPEGTTDESSGVVDRIRSDGAEPAEDESGSVVSRARAKYGLGALLAAVGVVLFLIPEPATSTAGIAMIIGGALLWFVSSRR